MMGENMFSWLKANAHHRDLDNPRYHWKKRNNFLVKGLFFQLMIAAVVQVSKLVWKLKTLTLSVGPTPALGAGKMATL